jgi:hypothetical protein
MGIAGVLWATALWGQAAGAEKDFPYAATVAHEAVLVRSGPGDGFYPTSRLLKAAEVEVHRHGPGGWCAVRPPAGEFSLIASDNVKLLPGDDLVEVVDREATVWVGSHIAKPDQHRWQIHLQPGERAAVLGVRAGAGENGKAVAWYKIAPPAGEFRWVPRETLTRENESPELTDSASDSEAQQSVLVNQPPPELPAEELSAAMPLTDSSKSEGVDRPGSDILPAPAGEAALVEKPSEVIPASVELPAESEPLSAESEPPLTPIPDDASQQQSPDEAPSPDPAFREADLRIDPKPRPPRGDGSPASASVETLQPVFDMEATALEVDLTLAVAQDLSRWRLGPLRDRAERLRDRAPSPESRQEAANLLDSIARFEQLYNRYLQYARPGSVAASRPQYDIGGAAAQAQVGDQDQFAATGQLAPLSPEFDTPPFALLDDAGRIQAYVTPADGLNLAKYAGAVVGIAGHSGMDEKLQTPHVIAAGVRMLRR